MSVPTLKTLHKDIELENKWGFIYDRKWYRGDWVLLEDLEAANARILVKMMTVFGEMDDDPTYASWGNKTWVVLKDNATELVLTQIRDYSLQALEEMRLVNEVMSISVQKKDLDPYVVVVQWVVKTITDDEISGGLTIG